MATTNPTITGSWSLIVQEGDEFLLTLPLASQSVHVAIGAADDSDSDPEPEAPPTDLLGHALVPGADGMNRALLGPGPVFAKCIDPEASVHQKLIIQIVSFETASIVLVALTAWTPA